MQLLVNNLKTTDGVYPELGIQYAVSPELGLQYAVSPELDIPHLLSALTL